MNELKRTIVFGGAALVLALLAFVTAPSRVTPDAFLDKDEVFFPDFTDPNSATTFEVIDYDEETGEAKPFKVTFQDGVWSIPSHHGYPADGKERLAKTAGGVIGTKKDEFRSDNIADHEALGVIDPLDETNTSLTGRGQRITMKGSNNQILADLVISKEEIEGKEKFRFVRIPGQKRVYASRMDIDISTKFSDWIEADFLSVDKNKIEEVTIKDYSINERTGSLQTRDTIELTKDGSDWKIDKLATDKEVDKTKVSDLTKALDELSIVGVRPKPEGLSASLTKMSSEGMSITQDAMRSLQSKGYYFTREGQLVSNEGEIQTNTNDGVIYTLRFGEVVYGSGLAVSAGGENADQGNEGTGENRYLFITTSFDGSGFKEPEKPANMGFAGKADSLLTSEDRVNKETQRQHDAWSRKLQVGQSLSDDLNVRFAGWYYVISSSSFDKLRLRRSDLLKEKKNGT